MHSALSLLGLYLVNSLIDAVMGFIGRIIEFLVMYDLLPAKIRWKKSASGVGRLFSDVFHLLDENEIWQA